MTFGQSELFNFHCSVIFCAIDMEPRLHRHELSHFGLLERSEIGFFQQQQQLFEAEEQHQSDPL